MSGGPVAVGVFDQHGALVDVLAVDAEVALANIPDDRSVRALVASEIVAAGAISDPGIVRADGLTHDEGKVLDLLTAAYNAYARLPVQHSSEPDDFTTAMNRLQDALAIRVARRCYPDGWPMREPPAPAVPDLRTPLREASVKTDSVAFTERVTALLASERSRQGRDVTLMQATPLADDSLVVLYQCAPLEGQVEIRWALALNGRETADQAGVVRMASVDSASARYCRVCMGPLEPDDEGPECAPEGCPGRSGG